MKKINLRNEALFLIVVLADKYIQIKRFLNQEKINRLQSTAAIDQLTLDYCTFNLKNLDFVAAETRNKILIDCFPIPLWIAANAPLVNCLSKKFKATVCSFGEAQRDPFVDVTYKSFHCKEHLLVGRSTLSNRWLKHLFFEAIGDIKSKNDLFNWSINGIQIGDEVYETYLRMFSKPTVYLKDIRCWYTIYTALKYFLYFEKYFKTNNVVAAVLSHDTYVATGVLAKIAWKNNVPVYLSNSVELKKTSYPDQKYSEFSQYRNYFSSLSDQDQIESIEWGKAQLQKRLGGEVGVNMAYSSKSAYTNNLIERQTDNSGKLKIVIATHCFFDNPRAYGGMIFTDFYEWISYLGEISRVTDYDWYIKTHRDFLPGTADVVRDLVGKYPKLKLVNPETSWHQLRQEGVSIALTCYGSIGHELPLLGYKVINVGYNPHIAYNFNWNIRSLSDYRDTLLNLGALGEIRELDSIYEFYYVHYKMSKQGGFLFKSYDELGEYSRAPGVLSNKIFNRVIDMSPTEFESVKLQINSFIESNKFSQVEKIIALNIDISS